MDDDSMKRPDEDEWAGIDLDESPFEKPPPPSGLPLSKDDRRELKRILAKYREARAKVGPGEYAYTDDSPFGIPPID